MQGREHCVVESQSLISHDTRWYQRCKLSCEKICVPRSPRIVRTSNSRRRKKVFVTRMHYIYVAAFTNLRYITLYWLKMHGYKVQNERYIWEILKTWDHKALTKNIHFVSYVTHASSICFYVKLCYYMY